MLQKLLIHKIDEFCGKQPFLDYLEKLKKSVPPDKRFFIINTICAVKLAYKTQLNLIEQTFTYKELALQELEFLQEHYKHKPNSMLLFLIELKQTKLDYVANIKQLA